MIPMVDLKAQFSAIKEEVFAVFGEVLESGQFILGPKVKLLEKQIADYLGVSEAVGVASGTDALHLSLKALGIGEGDEVITTPFTFFATAEAIVYVGARPVFVDIEPDTFNIDPVLIEEKITPKTKAIIPVHMFGHPADMERILALASAAGARASFRGRPCLLVEDCAQAFGASIRGRKVGGFGDAGCFSFYPSKNLGAYGDGGLVAVKSSGVADEIRSLRNHGSKVSYIHEGIGFNSRLDELQAGVLLVKFKRIDEYNEKRRQKAALYTELLSGKVICPVERPGCHHVYHQYTIVSPKRNEIQKALRENGISSVVYYPLPLHLQEALKYLGRGPGDFPIAEGLSRQALSLPIYPELEDSAIERIAKVVLSV